ncbi:MAG TPA: dephospho-CoA kinase [Chloroflexota bacterium]|nr:dephospho-CoA kinase [Chloroflexota bacterium]
MKHYLIGLTGNIGCGKSAVAAMLADLGAEVVDADLLVHQLMSPGSESWQAIVDRFGRGILRPDDGIDRRALGEIVFRDPAALAYLEAILHPATRRLVEERIAASKSAVVVVEAIKLIESGWYRSLDALWVVACSREQQIERIMRTRGFKRAEAELRVDAQPPAEEKLRYADVIIDNSGSLETTRRQVADAWQRIPMVPDAG